MLDLVTEGELIAEGGNRNRTYRLPIPDKNIPVIEREEIRKLRDSKKKLMLDE